VIVTRVTNETDKNPHLYYFYNSIFLWYYL